MPAESRSQQPDIELEQAPIVTRRLFLRAPEIADIPAIARLIGDPVIARNTAGIPHPYAPIEGWRFIRATGLRAAPELSASFLITLRGNPRQIAGGAGVQWGPGHDPEIGYWIAAAHRRRGFAGEVVRALLPRIFADDAIAGVRAWCRVHNLPSQRVLRRAGFRRVGTGLRYSRSQHRYVPAIEFAISRAQWGRHPRF